MWSSDPILMAILEPIFSSGSPFQRLPVQLERDDARDAKSLREGFEKLFGCQQAKVALNVVMIWTLDQKFNHSDGSREPSTVVYVEKTTGYISDRWQRYTGLLATGSDSATTTSSENLRALANRENLLFYKKIVASFGPLRVWYANVGHLNQASKHSLATAREWEHLILKRYRDRYGCLPLKTRRS
jgi:hypothetical protein